MPHLCLWPLPGTVGRCGFGAGGFRPDSGGGASHTVGSSSGLGGVVSAGGLPRTDRPDETGRARRQHQFQRQCHVPGSSWDGFPIRPWMRSGTNRLPDRFDRHSRSASRPMKPTWPAFDRIWRAWPSWSGRWTGWQRYSAALCGPRKHAASVLIYRGFSLKSMGIHGGRVGGRATRWPFIPKKRWKGAQEACISIKNCHSSGVMSPFLLRSASRKALASLSG